MIKSFSLFALLGVATLAPQAQAAGNIDCKLSFNLEGWSVFYKTASGTGTITCDNGAVIPVKISSKGGPNSRQVQDHRRPRHLLRCIQPQ